MKDTAQVRFVQPGHPKPPPTAPKLTPEQRAAELLAITDEQEFAHQLARSIRNPDLGEQGIFRSPQLAMRSHRGARFLLAEVNRLLEVNNQAKRTEKRSNKWLQSTLAHKNLVVAEMRLLDAIVDGIRAQNGVMGTQRSPRTRALERLATASMRGPLAKGAFTRFLAEEEAKVEAAKAKAKAEAAKAKEARKARTRADRQARGLPVAQPARRPGRPPQG